MSMHLFDQLSFVRSQTLKALEEVSEEKANIVPSGFRNSILWHAGHIYLVHERFAFVLQRKEAKLPSSFMTWFGIGSSPAGWTEQPPALADIREMLREQQARVEETWKGKFEEGSPEPYTTSAGITLETTEAFLNFTLYHEGMHFQAIKMYKMLLS